MSLAVLASGRRASADETVGAGISADERLHGEVAAGPWRADVLQVIEAHALTGNDRVAAAERAGAA
ncbi:MAG TPA: hypothetical protein VGJ15_04350 [Pirellulales bacterium]